VAQVKGEGTSRVAEGQCGGKKVEREGVEGNTEMRNWGRAGRRPREVWAKWGAGGIWEMERCARQSQFEVMLQTKVRIGGGWERFNFTKKKKLTELRRAQHRGERDSDFTVWGGVERSKAIEQVV